MTARLATEIAVACIIALVSFYGGILWQMWTEANDGKPCDCAGCKALAAVDSRLRQEMEIEKDRDE